MPSIPKLRDFESTMGNLRWLAFFIVLAAGVSVSQNPDNSWPQGSAVDCSDPSQAGSAACAPQDQRQNTQRDYSSPSERSPQLKTPESSAVPNTPRTPMLNPSQIPQRKAPPWPETEFQQMVADSAGRPLPL